MIPVARTPTLSSYVPVGREIFTKNWKAIIGVIILLGSYIVTRKKNSKFGSRQLKLEMDCDSSEMRIKRRFTYSGKFLSGVPVKDYYKTEEWRSIQTDSHLGAIFKKICRPEK